MSNTIRCKLSSKGQLTLPKKFRDKLNIHPGDEVIVQLKENSITILNPPVHLGMLRGILHEEIDVTKAEEFIQQERKKWRL
ncbi:MAG: AbrB/MazE/SpoVT family DNA-binding domain-containing protein [Promethearchaeota archaeon]